MHYTILMVSCSSSEMLLGNSWDLCGYRWRKSIRMVIRNDGSCRVVYELSIWAESLHIERFSFTHFVRWWSGTHVATWDQLIPAVHVTGLSSYRIVEFLLLELLPLDCARVPSGWRQTLMAHWSMLCCKTYLYFRILKNVKAIKGNDFDEFGWRSD